MLRILIDGMGAGTAGLSMGACLVIATVASLGGTMVSHGFAMYFY